jgi:hypothetical protein
VQEDLLILVLAQVLVDGFIALLDDYLIQLEFDSLTLNDLLFDSLHRNQSVDINVLLLTDSVRSIHCLQVDLRVPIGVVNDHMVC